QPVVAQSNDFSGTKASNGAGKEKEHEQDYILLPLSTADLPFSTTSKSSQDNEFQLSNDSAKKRGVTPQRPPELLICLFPTSNGTQEGTSSFKRFKLDRSHVFRNKMDERRIVIRNKARLVAQGHTHEEGIDYDEVFAPVARIEAIRLFLAYASFKDFIVYQMDVKSAFLYGKIEDDVYVCQPPGFEDHDFPNKVYKVY
nr:retrovirus-related Pol polyprotein from transposon TNT 1-94 [Tanacetum cinerariifolium]